MSDLLLKGELSQNDQAIHDALVANGFALIGRTTRGGNVLEYTYFNKDGVKVEIDYRHAHTPRTFSLED